MKKTMSKVKLFVTACGIIGSLLSVSQRYWQEGQEPNCNLLHSNVEALSMDGESGKPKIRCIGNTHTCVVITDENGETKEIIHGHIAL